MSDDFHDPKRVPKKRARRQESIENLLTGDVYITSPCDLAIGNRFGSFSLTTDYYSSSATSIPSDYFGNSGMVIDSSSNRWTAASAGSIGALGESATDIYFTSATSIPSDYFGNSGMVVGPSSNRWTAASAGSVGVLGESASDIYLTSATSIPSDYFGNSGVVVGPSSNRWTAASAGSIGALAESATDIYLASATSIPSDYFGNSGVVIGSSSNRWTAASAGSIGALGESATDIYLTSATSIPSDYLGNSGAIFERTAARFITSTSWEALPNLGTKRRRRFEILLPLQFNNRKHVPAGELEEAKRELLKLFGGVTWEKQAWGGLWEDGGVEYEDSLMRVFVDTTDLESDRKRMQQFNERWRKRLDQVQLYMTSRLIEVES